jgi:predicted ATPase
VAFEGEAGIGKTRLAEEFVAYGRTRGAQVVAVRCYEGEMDLAYVPIMAALRGAIKQQHEGWQERVPSHWLSEASRLLPVLSDLRPDLPIPPLDSAGAQSSFFEGLLQFWFALSAGAGSAAPVMFFFDDIHRADDASLEFLGYLSRRLQGQSLCLLLTWRNVQHAPLQRFRHLLIEAQRHEPVSLFTLSRLDQPAVARLVERAAPASGDLVHNLTLRLYQEIEGVPHLPDRVSQRDYQRAIEAGRRRLESATRSTRRAQLSSERAKRDQPATARYGGNDWAFLRL